VDVIAHRGLWKTVEEQNTLVAVKRAFEAGFGVEVDVRDYARYVILSHDPPVNNPDADLLSMVFEIRKARFRKLPIVIDIKSCGLATELEQYLFEPNWFCIGMPYPEAREYMKRKIPVYCRRSDEDYDLWKGSKGYWIDCFESDWWESVNEELPIPSVIVSPELHNRNPLGCWKYVRSLMAQYRPSICTDFPLELKEVMKCRV
jgi:hypothetical protein